MEKRTQQIIDWIKQYFVANGPEAKAIIGISGGKDSTVVAKLLCEALSPEKVIAVKIPQGEQYDINIANSVINYLKIPRENIFEINIGNICNNFYQTLNMSLPGILEDQRVTSNLPARVRMTILYAIASKMHGRVANTCNRSESYVGYATKFGDSAGDFSPLDKYTVREVIEIGKDLGIPDSFLYKPPEDGLTGLTDEENLGFSYKVLDDFLLDNVIPDYASYKTIQTMKVKNSHKTERIPSAPYLNKDGKYSFEF